MDLHHCHHCRLVGAQLLSHFSMVLEISSLTTQGLHYQRIFRVLPLQSLLELQVFSPLHLLEAICMHLAPTLEDLPLGLPLSSPTSHLALLLAPMRFTWFGTMK
jgi:hypothetical protein